MNTRGVPLSRMRGMSLIAMVLVLVIIGIVALLAMRIVPIYLDYNTLDSTIKSLQDDPGINSMSRVDATNALTRRFDIGYVDVIDAKDLKIREDRKNLVIELDYEDRRNIVANVDIVVHFQKTYTITR